MPGGPDYGLSEGKGEGTERRVTGPVCSTVTPAGVPPQKVSADVFGITENAPAKVPCMGSPSLARAPLGARTMVIAASTNRLAEIKIRFLLEITFREHS